MHPHDPNRDRPDYHDRERYDGHVAHSVPDRPARRPALWAGAVVAVLAAAWLVAFYGH